jgi:hypothetical protein
MELSKSLDSRLHEVILCAPNGTCCLSQIEEIRVQLNGSRVLITQAHLLRYMGSEIVTLEVAEYFASRGADVLVVTHAYGLPIKEDFDALENVRVFEMSDPDFESEMNSRQPDLVWVQHSIIPASVLEAAHDTRFIFNHMSSMLPIEFALNAELERMLASVILFESPRSLEVHAGRGLYEGVDSGRLQVLGNPAPQAFSSLPEAEPRSKITVVSNHIPDELIGALRTLGKDYELDLIGNQSELGAKPRRVDPETIHHGGAVVTIGKTVQYSLVSGAPVYCYDHFGGPGWLTDENIDRARYENFSGRGFLKKTDDEIVKEIREGFDSAWETARELRSVRMGDFSMPERMERLLQFVDANGVSAPVLDRFTIGSHDQMQTALGSYIREWVRTVGDVAWLQATKEALERELGDARLRIAELMIPVPTRWEETVARVGEIRVGLNRRVRKVLSRASFK